MRNILLNLFILATSISSHNVLGNQLLKNNYNALARSNSLIPCEVVSVYPSSLNFTAQPAVSKTIEVEAYTSLLPIEEDPVIGNDQIVDEINMCSNWQFSTNASWLTITKLDNQLSVIAQTNNTGSSRSAVITIGSNYSVTIYQEAYSLTAPNNYAAQNVTSNSFMANWSSVQLANSYKIDVSTNSTFSSILPNYNGLTISGTNINIVGLNANTTYYCRVKAISNNTTSSYSNTISVKTNIPAPIVNQTTMITENSFNCNWESVTGATGYQLDVSTNISFSSYQTGYSNLAVTNTSKIVSGLTPGTNYFFRVRAVNSNGVSQNSETTNIITKPGSPIANQATNINNSWFVANWNGTTGASSYQIDVSTDDDFSSFVGNYNNYSITVTSTAITALNSNTNYYYRVRAVNSSGAGQYSSIINLKTAPSTPEITSINNVGSGSFKVNWYSVPGATTYQIDVSTNSNFNTFVQGYNNATVTGTNLTVTGLSAGNNYFVRLRASNGTSTSNNSNTASTITCPNAPSSIIITNHTESSFDIHWESVAGATSYLIDVAHSNTFTSGHCFNLPVTTTSKSITGLYSGTIFYVRVRAVNAGGSSANSIHVATMTLPSSPVADYNQEHCIGSTVSNLYSTPPYGCVTDWYTTPTGGIALSSSSPLISGLYYAESRNTTLGYVSATRTTISVTTLDPVVITSQPTSVNINEGESITFSLAATGGRVRYQWQESTDNGLSWKFVDSNSPSYVISNTKAWMNNYKYKCFVYGPCTSQYSDIVSLNINTNNSLSNVTYSSPLLDKTVNYVNIIEPQTEINSDTLESIKNGLNSQYHYGDLINKITYLDDMGRPLQYISYRNSPTGKDIIQPIAYDELGRMQKQYLAYTNEYLGKYRANALKDESTYSTSEQYLFYQNTEGITHDQFPFSETIFENSPRGRVLEQGAVGSLWQVQKNADGLSNNLGHTLKKEYSSNDRFEVLCMTVDNSDNLIFDTHGELNSNKYYYNKGSLYCLTVKNENWSPNQSNSLLNTSKQYVDFKGRLILKENFVEENGSIKKVDTYYVYDLCGRLRYVIPPLAANTITLPTNPENITIKELCYYYTYDSKGRVTTKQLPGLDRIFYVYDNNDRVILSQDGNLRKSDTNEDLMRWQFIKYDMWNRPVLNGVYTHSSSLSQTEMQNFVDQFYLTNNKNYESHTAINPTILGYTNQAFPTSVTENNYLTAIYYDNYDFTSDYGFNNLAFNNQLADFDSYTDIDDVNNTNNYFDRVNGLLTGVRTKILDGNEFNPQAKWSFLVSFYDQKYRPIQIRGSLLDGNNGNYSLSYKYSFSGKVKKTRETQVFSGISTSFERYYTYDHAGRIIKKELKIDGDLQNNTITLEEFKYNELGLVSEKNIGNEIQSIDYSYNIRGWLENINNPSNLTDDGNDIHPDRFAQRLNYTQISLPTNTDDPNWKPNYNGLISEQEWAYSEPTSNTDHRMGFKYKYDELNRLTAAGWCSYNGENWTRESNKFDSRYTYDIQGNIKSLSRYGMVGDNSFALIDNLTYSYSNGNLGNKLLNVTDISANSNGYMDGNSGTVALPDFLYDRNGNMLTEKNRQLSIAYNILNLPNEVKSLTNSNTDKIKYLYSATGAKIETQHILSNNIQKYYYAGSIVYKHDGNEWKPEYINTGSGKILYNSNLWKPQYFLSDHLGNIRAIVERNSTNGTPDVVWRQSYDPYGNDMLNNINISGENQIKFNGKEQQAYTINGQLFDFYDYGARFYDPKLGRWHSTDPFCEAKPGWSTYRAFFNNPINISDPNGLYEDYDYDYDYDDDRNRNDDDPPGGRRIYQDSDDLPDIKLEIYERPWEPDEPDYIEMIPLQHLETDPIEAIPFYYESLFETVDNERENWVESDFEDNSYEDESDLYDGFPDENKSDFYPDPDELKSRREEWEEKKEYVRNASDEDLAGPRWLMENIVYSEFGYAFWYIGEYIFDFMDFLGGATENKCEKTVDDYLKAEIDSLDVNENTKRVFDTYIDLRP